MKGIALTDELRGTAYAVDFADKLNVYVAENRISRKVAKTMIQALTDADEVRDLYAAQISALLFGCIDQKKDYHSVLDLIVECCEEFGGEESHALILEKLVAAKRRLQIS